MTAATVAITPSQIYTVLGNAIVGWLGIAPNLVFRANPNRTAMPLPSPGFVVMGNASKKRLRTNVDYFAPTGSPAPALGPVTSEQAQDLVVQIDCWGPSSSQWADILTTLLRDNIGCLALAPYCQPLYADDPIRGVLTDAELEYEDRWIVQAHLQYNQVIGTGQDYATILGPVDVVDVTPGGGFAPGI
jgi:hypothetical protein